MLTESQRTEVAIYEAFTLLVHLSESCEIPHALANAIYRHTNELDMAMWDLLSAPALRVLDAHACGYAHGQERDTCERALAWACEDLADARDWHASDGCPGGE